MRRSRSRRDRGRSTALIVTVVLFGVIAGVAFWKQHQRKLQLEESARVYEEEQRKKDADCEARLAPFKGKTQALLALATAAAEQLEATPSLHGKLAVIRSDDPGRGEIDPIQVDLGRDHVATKPDEIGTVILISRAKEVAGTYEKSHSTGYRRTCDLTLVDVARKVVVARKHIAGDEPDATKQGTNTVDVYGSDPSIAVIFWIDALPMK